jgi:TonB family protein
MVLLAGCATRQQQAPAAATAQPPPIDRSYRAVPPYVLDQLSLAGPMPHLPDVVKIRRWGTGPLRVAYMVYVDPDGIVRRVDVTEGSKDADSEIVRVLKTWRFKPQPTGIRSLMTFIFTLPGPQGGPGRR